MKATLYMAISIDWFIATEDWNSDWISENDIEIFDKTAEAADSIIIGNTTYHQYKWEIYPIKDTCNIIVSKENQEDSENTYFVKSPEEAINLSKEKWCERILLVWGWHINGSFLNLGLIDEIIIDIQPIILGKWIKIFEEIKELVNLEFTEYEKIAGWLNILKYKVKK